MSDGWSEVSRDDTCPICSKTTWCSRSEGGAVAICRRQCGEGGVEKVDRNGAPFWVHHLNGYGEAIKPKTIAHQEAPHVAAFDTLDKVYTALLAACPLSDEHRDDLVEERGLPAEEVERRQYGSLSYSNRELITGTLEDQFGRELLLAVPGFFVQERDDKTELSLAGRAGLLIPVRARSGLIRAIKIRADRATEKNRYIWLSSKGFGGASPGAPVHVPLCDSSTETIRITEGELKADITTALSGMLTISMPGASSWQSILPVVVEIKPKSIQLAFDADKFRNRHVARAQSELFGELKRLGYQVGVLTWPKN